MLYIVDNLNKYTTYADEQAWGLPRKYIDVPYLRKVANFEENALKPTISQYIAYYESYRSLQYYILKRDQSVTCPHCNTVARLSDWLLHDMQCPFCHIKNGVTATCQ